jgi:hypothetical protein
VNGWIWPIAEATPLAADAVKIAELLHCSERQLCLVTGLLLCIKDRLQCARTSHSLQRGIRLHRRSTPAGVNFGYVP